MQFGAPIDLGEDEARDLLITELGKPEYQQARPNLIDQVGKAIADWFASLLNGDLGGTPPIVPFLIALGIVVLVVVIALIVGGVPRRDRAAATLGALFGEDESRSATEIARAAEAAAAREDWSTAVTEMFRAIGRGLQERGIVAARPGMTARALAADAARRLPGEAGALAAAARTFDAVRYLGRSGTRGGFDSIAALETRIRATRPVDARGPAA